MRSEQKMNFLVYKCLVEMENCWEGEGRFESEFIREEEETDKIFGLNLKEKIGKIIFSDAGRLFWVKLLVLS